MKRFDDVWVTLLLLNNAGGIRDVNMAIPRPLSHTLCTTQLRVALCITVVVVVEGARSFVDVRAAFW